MTRRRYRSVLVGAFSAIHMLAATYYVGTNGDDSYAGSQDAPFQHLSRAASVAQAGDTVIVMDGTYNNEGRVASADGGGSVVVPQNSGTADAPITFMAQNRGQAILNGGSTVQSSTLPGCYGAWAYFDLYHVSYITVQGFVIENTCIQGIASNGNGQHDFTFRWNEFKNIGLWTPPSGYNPQGNYANSTESNFVFDGNIFHDIGGGATVSLDHGIYTSASNVKIINNVFYNIKHGWGIQVAGAKDVTIANNTFAYTPLFADGQIVLWDRNVADSLSNITIVNNIFYQPGGAAVVSVLSIFSSIGGCNIQSNLTTAGRIWDNGSPCTVANNRTNTDPGLVNPTDPYDFHLQQWSPAIGAGIAVPGLATDLTGVARLSGTVSDAGAYASSPPGGQGQGSGRLLPGQMFPWRFFPLLGLGIVLACGMGSVVVGVRRARHGGSATRQV